MDEALRKSGDYPNIALTPGTHVHAATGEAVEIPASARVDGGELGLENTIIGLHDALIEATCIIVELDAEKAGGMAMAVEYYAHKLRQFGFDVPPTPMEESEMDE